MRRRMLDFFGVYTYYIFSHRKYTYPSEIFKRAASKVSALI